MKTETGSYRKVVWCCENGKSPDKHKWQNLRETIVRHLHDTTTLIRDSNKHGSPIRFTYNLAYRSRYTEYAVGRKTEDSVSISREGQQSSLSSEIARASLSPDRLLFIAHRGLLLRRYR